MPNQPARTVTTDTAPTADARQDAPEPREELAAGEMPCPVCGSPMPDLKGGKATICPTCGFKDSCCY